MIAFPADIKRDRSMTEIPGHVFPRKLDQPLPVAARAEGLWIVDSQGKRYLDASGGPVLVNVGHGREEIARAVYEQILQCDYVHGTMFTTAAVENLAQALADHAPPGIERFYFLSGGGEAVETAIKLARQIHLEYGRPQRVRLIARWKSYHGLTLGALAATGRTTFRAPFAPLLNEVVHLPPPYCLRCSYGLTYPACRLRCALALDELIQNVGPDTVSAFLAETVSGATIAGVPAPPGYFTLIREICDRYQVLLILDEVLCGLGRTGRWFASEHYDVIPDIVTMGKGLGGGAVALSAVGVQAAHFDAIASGSGGFVHGGTFSHHSVAAAAGLEVVRIFERQGIVERVAHLGAILGRKLKARLGDHPNVADIRGLGFLWGVEFVKNKETLEPFPRREKFVERLWKSIFQRGVVVYRATGLAGIDGDALVVGPPYIIEKDQLDLVVEAIAEGLGEVVNH
jgi:adenosylmethionine-8-amino-7-oxononanoate aminotransferase